MQAKSTETTYSNARQNFARLMDKVTNDREVVFINRHSQAGSAQRVALVDAQELAGLQETAHLLRSPKNAARLLKALERALGIKRKSAKPSTVAFLKRSLGLG
jgi:antitoxin YefM